jgi:hydroxymethylglutaryl-CoA lyase
MGGDVRIVEVGPRDGLQNEPAPVGTATKLELVRRLVDAGLREVEVTAFVSPKWVPQMADHREVMAALAPRDDLVYHVLTPNLRGLQAALAAGARQVAVFAAASETFSRRNINCSIDESLARFAPVMAEAARAGIRVRGYVSCAVACPYEGPVAPQAAARVARALHEMGCHEVSLGDTIGTGTPGTVLRLLEAAAQAVPLAQLAGHFHDTYGMGVANVLAAYQFGVRCFDASVAGLGGCPYARGATGNVATEDVVYLLEGLGVRTGIDLDALVDAGDWICRALGRRNASRTATALLARRTAKG